MDDLFLLSERQMALNRPERIMIDFDPSEGAPHSGEPSKKGLFPVVSGA